MFITITIRNMSVESSNSKRAVSFSIPEVTQVEGAPRKGSDAEKRVNVTITILSMAGLFVKDSGGKRKKKKRKGVMASKKKLLSNSSVKNIATEEEDSTATEGTSNNGTTLDAPTMMVASFSRLVHTQDGQERTVMTHVPSLPIQLPHNTDNGGTSVKSKTVNSPVHWPGQLQDYDDEGQKILSSYQFESTVNTERIPEPFSIQISISRYGRMINLGTAHIPLTGEENVGETKSIDVPIATKPFTSLKKLSTVSIDNDFCETTKMMINMVKLKGSTLKCGLDPNAKLRVLVHVSDIDEKTSKMSSDMIANTTTQREDEEEQQQMEREMEKLHDDDVSEQSYASTSFDSGVAYDYNPKMKHDDGSTVSLQSHGTFAVTSLSDVFFLVSSLTDQLFLHGPEPCF